MYAASLAFAPPAKITIFSPERVWMGSFFVCLILPIGFIMMTAGLHNECESDRKVAANP